MLGRPSLIFLLLCTPMEWRLSPTFSVTLQTWSWSGKGWLQRQNMGPAARTGISLAGDTKRNRLILFGGQITGGSIVSETWALQRSAVPPAGQPSQI